MSVLGHFRFIKSSQEFIYNAVIWVPIMTIHIKTFCKTTVAYRPLIIFVARFAIPYKRYVKYITLFSYFYEQHVSAYFISTHYNCSRDATKIWWTALFIQSCCVLVKSVCCTWWYSWGYIFRESEFFWWCVLQVPLEFDCSSFLFLAFHEASFSKSSTSFCICNSILKFVWPTNHSFLKKCLFS